MRSSPKSLMRASAVLLAAASPLLAQGDSVFVAANAAACRAAPSADAQLVTRLMVGDIGARLDASPGWTRLSQPEGPCWVSESLVVVSRRGDRARTLIDAADRMIDRRPRPSDQDFASLRSLVDAQLEADGDEASPTLHLTRLLLLDAAGLPNQPVSGRAYQTDIMRYFESGDRWQVRREVYQALYERYRDDPRADQLAWVWLRFAGLGECEDDPNCWLGRIERAVMEYWSRFPDGRHVGEALVEALELLEIVEGYACWTGRDDYTVVSDERLDAMRASLDSLSDARRDQVVAAIEAVRAACAGAAGTRR